jgi:predicted nucleic acid-binding protein
VLYFDTSFVTPLIRQEATSLAVDRFLKRRSGEDLTISHWTRVELSSLLARDVRMGLISPAAAIEADAQFEAIVAASFTVLLPGADDFDLCKRYLQRFETRLRVGDALHLAIASNARVAAVYSLDRQLIKAARLLGLSVEHGIRVPGANR